MLRSTREAARRLGVSRRQVNRSVRSGRVLAQKTAGTVAVSDRAILAADRTAARGRRWSERTARAALELLEFGSTEQLTSSERGRLKARLRASEPHELAYQLLTGHASLWRVSSTDARASDLALADELGLAGQGGLSVEVTQDEAKHARANRLIRDGEGDVLLVARDAEFRRTAEALGLFAFGSTRESEAAASWLRKRVQQL